LVTYTWRGEGELFPIREGKNFIGSGDVSSEAYHRSCDVLVPQDNTMSAEHALILCRQGNYEIIDQISSNGTFLGGQMLRANQGTDLPNYAEIKTGSTLWTFIKVNPPPGEVSQPARKAPPEAPPAGGGDKPPTAVR
jgi:pSer/pThr/pTyr-binding forkhead associated (FHA) protein